MTDITLNPTLTARFKAVQEYWHHDNLGETIALVLDAAMHKWDIPAPNTPNIVVDKSTRVRLKARHVAYFTQMSHLSGLTVSEIVRGVLIQWICSHQDTQMSHVQTQKLPQHTQISHLPPIKSSSKRKKLPPTTQKSTQHTQMSHDEVQQSPVETTGEVEQATSLPQQTQKTPVQTELFELDAQSSPDETQVLPKKSKLSARDSLSNLRKKK